MLRGRFRSRLHDAGGIGDKAARLRAAYLVGVAFGVTVDHVYNTADIVAHIFPGLTMNAALIHGSSVDLEASFNIGVDEMAAITRTREIAAALNIGTAQAVEISKTLYLAASMGIGVDQAVNITRTKEVAAALGVGVTQDVTLTREKQFVAAKAIGIAVSATITRTREISAAEAIGLAMASTLSHVAPTVNTFDGTDGANTAGNWTIPAHSQIIIEAWGPGSAGIGLTTTGTSTGTLVQSNNTTVSGTGITTMSLVGAKSGTGGNTADGTPGTATGGNTTNTAGSTGSVGGGNYSSPNLVSGQGGSTPGTTSPEGVGGAQQFMPDVPGAGQTVYRQGFDATDPGAGGGSSMCRINSGSVFARPAGQPSGGYSKTVVNSGTLTPGNTLAYNAGRRQTAASSTLVPGGKGGCGRVRFTVIP